MLQSERQNEIIAIIKQKGFVKARELCDRLYASEASIRRDLTYLEKQGFIRRRHGGAEDISSGSSIIPFSLRSYEHVNEKHMIAKKAARLVEEGQVIFLDQSSTSYFLAVAIREMKNLTVVTNNIEIVNILSRTNVSIYCSGGMLSKENKNCLIGSSAIDTFRSIYADLMFFSTKAVSIDGLICDCFEEETAVRNAMLDNSAKHVFLCSSEKIGFHAPFVQCRMSDIDIAISEEDAFESYKTAFPHIEVI